MKTLHTILAASVLAAVAGSAMADTAVVKDGYAFDRNQLIPTGVRAEVGTTGYGGALLWTANPYVGLALGYNGGDISWSDDLSINGTKYDMDMDNNLTYLNAEIRPWGASPSKWAQGVYVAAGVGYIDNEYGLDKRNKNAQGTIHVNDVAYIGEGGVKGKLAYENDIAPYLGLGFAPKINNNWGVFGEVGAYYTGNPTVELEEYGNLVGGVPIAESVRAEAQKIRNDDKYEWMPVAKLGVSYHW
ncbi:MAG TPA: ornithine uptake porin CarO [Acinetobacter towneri]|uniref:ornithine uptake porin CarO n=1 Tax=unclassified Acinetobacter TaxID=196816 RepID=UPI0015D3D37D|nr:MULTISPECIES: ornithine uptake porin CarO [unclassified Acinetobacter]HRO77485.1 ornithine uptake porin CarO [Acinetobacter towneri]